MEMFLNDGNDQDLNIDDQMDNGYGNNDDALTDQEPNEERLYTNHYSNNSTRAVGIRQSYN